MYPIELPNTTYNIVKLYIKPYNIKYTGFHGETRNFGAIIK